MPSLIGIFFFLVAAIFAPAEAAQPIAYVVVGDNGAQVARVLTEDAKCPLIALDRVNVRMEVRARPATLSGRIGKPSAFPLLTCEKKIPASTRHAAVDHIDLPLLHGDIQRIVVIGDTGCRLKDGAYQACNDSALYPFAKIAAAAASWKPDLVIHVGDLIYRESPCPSDHPECRGSPWGYGWDAWNADFFAPGADLLQSAPWVLVRGNHESCSRAGQGWWRMIDFRPLRPGRDCNLADDDDVGDYSDPYAVPLGDDEQLIVMDTSNTLEKPISQSEIRTRKYRKLYRMVEKLAQHASYNIVADHHPILGYFAEQDRQGVVTVKPGNQGMQSVLGTLNPEFFPSSVDVLLSGHVHAWQQVSFSTRHPSQFIAGFSGTKEDSAPLPDSVDVQPAPGAMVEHLSSWAGGFGYMTIERKGPYQWEARVWDADGNMRNVCNIDGRHSVCDQARIE